MNIEEFKGGVWIFAEQRDGVLQNISLELVSKGREIAKKLNTKVVAVLLGDNVSSLTEKLIEFGADEVLLCESPLLKDFTTDGYTKVICDLANEKKPEIILVGASYIGRDLGPRISGRLHTGLTADCTELDIDDDTNILLATRPAFGGNLIATIVCEHHRPQMATVRPGVFTRTRVESPSGKVINIEANISKEDIRTRVIEKFKEAKEIVDIQEADFLISGGRGIGSKEGFEILGELANELGGQVAGSRAAVDKGWVDKELQVGQTGKTVRPTIYFAIGISGAIQHTAGIGDADYIIAINKDPDAAIMKFADLGIVGDYKRIIPEIIQEIKARKLA